MAGMEKPSAQSQVESGSFTQCGCQVSPGKPVSVQIAPAQREFRDVALAADTQAGFAPIATYRTKGDYTPPDPALYRHSQSVLCTFLI